MTNLEYNNPIQFFKVTHLHTFTVVLKSKLTKQNNKTKIYLFFRNSFKKFSTLRGKKIWSIWVKSIEFQTLENFSQPSYSHIYLSEKFF
jgi:hypothetical protein